MTCQAGTYTYAIDNQGTMSCGAVAGAHTVIRPTSLAIATDVTHDCGDGGTVVANVATEDVTYDRWSTNGRQRRDSGLKVEPTPWWPPTTSVARTLWT